jgi:hypothetical protein
MRAATVGLLRLNVVEATRQKNYNNINGLVGAP